MDVADVHAVHANRSTHLETLRVTDHSPELRLPAEQAKAIFEVHDHGHENSQSKQNQKPDLDLGQSELCLSGHRHLLCSIILRLLSSFHHMLLMDKAFV